MAKKEEGMDLRKIIADAERYQEAVTEANRLGDWEHPTARDLYDTAKGLWAMAFITLRDKMRQFERLGKELGFVSEDSEEDGE